MINIPPGCCKSLLIAVLFPAWLWITHPETRFMYASYAQNLSTRDSVKCRMLIHSPWYQKRWGDKFRLVDDQNQKTRYDTNKTGWRIATSPGGLGTGEHPDILVCDDPHNVKESESDVERQSVLDWWDGTISTRGVSRGVRRIVVMQRLHEMDLCGHILAKEKAIRKSGEDTDWDFFEHICLPMRFEKERMTATSLGWLDPRQVEGDLLWPSLFPEKKVRTSERNLQHRAAGQLQQRPTAAAGGTFKVKWLRFYTSDSEFYLTEYGSHKKSDCWRFCTNDLAVSEKEKADYTVFSIWDVAPNGDMFLLYVFRAQITSPETIKTAIRLYRQFDLDFIGIESVQYQLSVVQHLRVKGLAVKELRPKGDKESRATAAAVRMEACTVFFPEDRPSWYQAFEDEILQFPNGKNDDQVDTYSYAAHIVGKRYELTQDRDPEAKAELEKIEGEKSRELEEKAETEQKEREAEEAEANREPTAEEYAEMQRQREIDWITNGDEW